MKQFLLAWGAVFLACDAIVAVLLLMYALFMFSPLLWGIVMMLLITAGIAGLILDDDPKEGM